jgi:mono/diheme cytochrome c family protein
MRARTILVVVATLTACSATPAFAEESTRRGVGELSGKQLFDARCGACHYVGGGGTLMLAKRLGKEKSLLEERKDLLPLYVRTVARQGVGSMPWFTRTELPDADLNAIADYLSAPSR